MQVLVARKMKPRTRFDSADYFVSAWADGVRVRIYSSSNSGVNDTGIEILFHDTADCLVCLSAYLVAMAEIP